MMQSRQTRKELEMPVIDGIRKVSDVVEKVMAMDPTKRDQKEDDLLLSSCRFRISNSNAQYVTKELHKRFYEKWVTSSTPLAPAVTNRAESRSSGRKLPMVSPSYQNDGRDYASSPMKPGTSTCSSLQAQIRTALRRSRFTAREAMKQSARSTANKSVTR
jgi:hypothetical protein